VDLDPSGEEAVFGRWLRRRRRVLDLTQKVLARKVGCSPATIRKLEADERRPSRRLASELAGVLGVPQGELEAFVRFARSGWADRPPPGAGVDRDRPWWPVGAVPGAVPGAAPGPAGSALEPAWPLESVPPPQTTSLPAPNARSGARASARAQVVGRDRELAVLEANLAEALAGSGRVALVRGEAGQGKSTLLWRFAALAQDAHPELVVAAGSCNGYTGTGDPFQPFREILGELTGDQPGGGAPAAFERRRLERLRRFVPKACRSLAETSPALVGTLLPGAPLLARWTRAAGAPPVWLANRATQSAVHEGFQGAGHAALRASVAAFLAALARQAPLLLLLDDLQWVDDSSADTLLHLARSASEQPVLVVGAFRSSEVASPAQGGRHVVQQLLRQVERQHDGTVVDLDRSDGRAFLEAWLDTEPNVLDAGFRDALWRLTSGQPLFTIELLRAMQERGELARDAEGRWTAAGTLRWVALPDRVAAVLDDRIERLDRASREVLGVASVEGEAFTVEVVARVLDREPRVVARVIGADLHRQRHLVAPLEMRRGREGLVSRYRFRHNLIQQHVAQRLDPAERGHLHEAVGDALEALLGDAADPVALAAHFQEARAPQRAAPHLRRAGARARENGAVDQAIRYFRQALDAWPGADGRGLATVHRELGECRFAMGDVKRAAAELERSHELFRAAGDATAGHAALAMLGFVLYESIESERAFRACNEAVAQLERGPDTAELAMALGMRAQLHMMRDHDALALADGERALAMAGALQVEDSRVRALASVAAVLAKDPERREEGFALLEEAYRAADALGLAQFASSSLGNLGVVQLAVGRSEEGRRSLERALDYARSRGVGLHESWLVCSLWQLHWAQGRWAGALREMDALLAMVEDARTLTLESWSVPVYLASALVDLGRYGAAAALLDAHVASLSRLDEETARLPYLRARLRLAAAGGDAETAQACVTDMVDALGSTSTHQIDVVAPLLTACRWLAGRLASGAGADGLDRVLTALEQADRQYGPPVARSGLLEARAALAGARGDPSGAAALALQAAEGWHAAGYRLDEARALCLAAQGLTWAGRDDGGERTLAEARAILAALAEQLPEADQRAAFAEVQRRMAEAPGMLP